jgi:hypothetical protein
MRLECETSFYNDEKLDGDLTHAQETADEAKELAEQAGGTATNYLYESVEKGLVVSRTKVATDTQVEELTTPNSRVVSDGFDVYKDGTTRVAHFGETTVIGEEGKAKLIVDSDSLELVTASTAPAFKVENGIEGTGSNVEKWVEVTEGYLNQDGTLNKTALASILDTMVSGRTLTSAPGDYVITVDDAELTVELFGSGMMPSGDYTDMLSQFEVYAFNHTLINGVLTATAISESEPSDWYDFIDNFVLLFPEGTKNYQLYLTFTLTYKISDVQMTLGTRNAQADIGARSVSIGGNNIASGTGSVAIGKDLEAVDDYSLIIGENNVDIEDPYTGVHMPTAFAIGANGTTPFAVLKNGIMVMSAVNSGKSPQQQFAANTATDVRIDFEHEYPNTPFIFLTLNEDNVPQSAVSDYGSTQIYLKMADTTGFTATVVNGGTKAHTFSFSWFAISIM